MDYKKGFRGAVTRAELKGAIDTIADQDCAVLIIGHRSDDDDTSYVSVHRRAHGFESIGLIRYALEDELNDTVRKHRQE